MLPADALVVSSPFVPYASLFDACHVGVVLRVVLLVQAVAGVGAMFGTSGPLDWLLRFSLLTGSVLPATLGWLIAVCAFKVRLNRLQVPWQWLAGTVLGAAAGVYACGLLALMGMLLPAMGYILDGSLSELEEHFGSRFMRIHRNALTARRAVRALEKHFDPEEGEGWAVRLNGLDELLAVSRRQLAAVRDAIAN